MGTLVSSLFGVIWVLLWVFYKSWDVSFSAVGQNFLPCASSAIKESNPYVIYLLIPY